MNHHYQGELSKSIKSGNLYKKGKINKSWQKRWCILSRDSKLFYHKHPNEKHSGFVDLRQCIIKKSECTEKENIFEINTSSRIFLFSADSKSEMDEWMKTIYTHSKVQQENDLIERAEYIIRDQSHFKSNLDDEFLKFKHSFNPYIPQQQTNDNNNNNETANEYISIPSSLLSFGYHNSNNNSNSNSNNNNGSLSPSLSSYIPKSTKSLCNNFNFISNHDYSHPYDLIIQPTPPTTINTSTVINNFSNTSNSSPPYGSPSSNFLIKQINASITTNSTTTTNTDLNNSEQRLSSSPSTQSQIVDSNIKETDKATQTRRFSFLFK